MNMRQSHLNRFGIWSCLLLWASCVQGQSLRLAEPFTDHMVLQRGVRIMVWGETGPGEAVTVRFAGQQQSSVADSSGRWALQLPAQAACDQPRQLQVASGGETLSITDVLVGDVWVAAGQSNMQFALKQALHGREAMAQANCPEIRLMHRVPAAGGDPGAYTRLQLQRLTPQQYYRGGWSVCTTQTAGEFSAVAYYFGRELHEQLKVPIGLIDLAVGGTPTESWVRVGALREDPPLRCMVTGSWLENPVLEPWCQQRARDNLALALRGQAASPTEASGPAHPFKPGFCWAAGVEPLLRFPIRGVIWYQGESNAESAERAAQHARLFKLLIEDWRRSWSAPRMPFYFVQLPGMNRPNWPAFRETQRRVAAASAHTRMAVTIDLGDRDNVHPPDKREVGRRMALLALADTYGLPGVYRSPQLQAVHRDGAVVRVDFVDVGEGLKATGAGPINSFELAGDDGEFHPAHVQLNRDHVLLHSARVDQPRRVRYAWVAWPGTMRLLTNSDSLPLSPFDEAIAGER